MWKKAKDKLLECEKNGVETTLLRKGLSWNRFKKLIRDIPVNPTPEDFRFLREFKFEKVDKL